MPLLHYLEMPRVHPFCYKVADFRLRCSYSGSYQVRALSITEFGDISTYNCSTCVLGIVEKEYSQLRLYM